MDKRAIIAAALADPEILWAIKSAKVTVLGPWVKADRTGTSVYDGLWRCRPKGREVMTVYPSSTLEKPELYMYQTGHEDGPENGGEGTDYYNEDAYEADLEEWEVLKSTWKPWSYRIEGEPSVYCADTREEAVAKADQALMELGYLLYDGPKAAPKLNKTELILKSGD